MKLSHLLIYSEASICITLRRFDEELKFKHAKLLNGINIIRFITQPSEEICKRMPLFHAEQPIHVLDASSCKLYCNL
jgi:hypothetical protein